MFPFRLRLALGGHGTLKQMMHDMSSAEYHFWKAVDWLIPLGELAGEDRRRAIEVAAQLNANRKKGTQAIRVEKLMLRPPAPLSKKKMGWEAIGAAMRQLVAATAKRDKPKVKKRKKSKGKE